MDENASDEDEDDEDIQLNYKIYKLEKLIERRELLRNNCKLRSNLNNVDVWLERLEIVQKKKDP